MALSLPFLHDLIVAVNKIGMCFTSYGVAANESTKAHLSLERLRLNFCDCDSIPKEVEMDLATCLKEISHGRDVCAVPFQTEEGKISL